MIVGLVNSFMSISSGIWGFVLETTATGETTGQANIFLSMLRIFFAAVDRIIISLINQVFDLLMAIADTNIFGDEIIRLVGTRIYALVAIFMLFKIAITMIKYLAEPDSFDDQKSGFGKLISKVMIALFMLAFVPTIFDWAFDIQTFVIKNKTLERIVFGTTDTLGSNQSRSLSFSLFSAFFVPDPRVVGSDCDGAYFANSIPESCLSAIEAANEAEGASVNQNFRVAYEDSDAEILLSPVLIDAKNETNDYIFRYDWLISTIVGGIALLILVSFCFDIAIRSVKLGFLQLIAPIPILSSIDPSSEIFKKWYESCFKTYLDLFIRLIAVFFAVFVIAVVKSGINSEGIKTYSGNDSVDNSLVMIAIILGSLLFAKELPKLISDITGLKLDGGGFSLNPLDRLKQVPIAGTVAAGAIGGAGGALGGFVGGRESGMGLWKGVHGLTGGIGAGISAVPMKGTKEGEKAQSVFGAARGKAYKDATGNEMAILSSEKMMAGLFPEYTKGVVDKRTEKPKQMLKQIKQDQAFIENELAVKKDDYIEYSKTAPAATAPASEREAWETGRQDRAKVIADLQKRSGFLEKQAKPFENQIEQVKKAMKVDESTTKTMAQAEIEANKQREKLKTDYNYKPPEPDDTSTPPSTPPVAPPSTPPSTPPPGGGSDDTDDTLGRGTYF